MKEIYLAGGCFWGMERYIDSIPGVIKTDVGYANGKTENPTYEEVCKKDTGHAETVRIAYDEEILPLDFLLYLFFDAIDPTSVNRQGGDVGIQYRSGIYYTDESDLKVIEAAVQLLQKQLDKPVAIEVKPLSNYYPAEEYHQKYLVKNPQGYCHIHPLQFERAKNARINPNSYSASTKEDLKSSLDSLQYEVTQNAKTESPFNNTYWNTFRQGIYVDITSGEPLFSSSDKFESGCGWPSFSKPIDPHVLKELRDNSHGMRRMEVRSRVGNAHLGHVFEDGPKEAGGLRYCINSASLRFIPKDDMEKEGYGYLLSLV